MNIGENTKKIRTDLGMTQEELASQVGIGKSMLCQIERGTKAMSLSLAYEISKVFKCSIYDLLGRGEDDVQCRTA